MGSFLAKEGEGNWKAGPGRGGHAMWLVFAFKATHVVNSGHATMKQWHAPGGGGGGGWAQGLGGWLC